MNEILLRKQGGRVLYLTLNRPEALNALDNALLQALDQAFSQVANDEAIRCVVLTGAGERAFAAGADIEELSRMNALQASRFSRLGSRMMRRIETLGKPVIAAVNGYALGGGCELAMACHLRIAHERARFGLPEITLGLIPGFGGSQRLPRLVGRARALEMCLTGKPVTAEQAQAMGLVNQVHDDAHFLPAVEKLAEQLADNAAHATATLLQTMNSGLDLPLEHALELESQQFGLCFDHPDAHEGTQAFLQKRKPKFL